MISNIKDAGKMVKSTGFSFRGPKFDFQHTHGDFTTIINVRLRVSKALYLWYTGKYKHRNTLPHET